MSEVPDIEAIVTAYLAADPGVSTITEDILDTTPDSTASPWVRITQLDASPFPGDVADHAIEGYLQFDCYAGSGDEGHAEAAALYRAVRAALRDIHLASHTGAVVNGARIRGAARIPDIDLEPARERFVLTASVYHHAT